MQLNIGVFNRIAGHAQRFGQGACGRQLDPGTQGAIQNQCPQGTLNALVKIQGLKFVIVKTHLQGVQFKRTRHAVCSREY